MTLAHRQLQLKPRQPSDGATEQARPAALAGADYESQTRNLSPASPQNSYPAQSLALSPLQCDSGGGAAETASPHAVASKGMSGSGGALPHLERIQHTFGRFDVSGIRAHTDAAAAEATQALGAKGYAHNGAVALAPGADLHTTAHEAAHVFQQRGGVQLKGGVGAAGDTYERQADAVADAVVAGRSAEPLLARIGGSDRDVRGAVQLKSKEPEDVGPIEPNQTKKRTRGAGTYSHRGRQVSGKEETKREKYLLHDITMGAKNAKSEDYRTGLQAVSTNLARAYGAMTLSWRHLSAVYAEAWSNIAAVMQETSPWESTIKTTGALAGIFGGKGSPFVSRMLSPGGSFLFRVGSELLNASKKKVKMPAGINSLKAPSALRNEGLTRLLKEERAIQDMLTHIGNREDRYSGLISGSELLSDHAAEWAALQASAEADAARASTHLTEVRLWKTMLNANKEQFKITNLGGADFYALPDKIIDGLAGNVGLRGLPALHSWLGWEKPNWQYLPYQRRAMR